MFKEDNYKELRMIERIHSFISEEDLTGDNLKYSRLYNRIAWSYNLSQRLFFWFKYGGERKFSDPFLSELAVKDNDKVLEVSTGTGDK